jgi:hypothetical protein
MLGIRPLHAMRSAFLGLKPFSHHYDVGFPHLLFCGCSLGKITHLRIVCVCFPLFFSKRKAKNNARTIRTFKTQEEGKNIGKALSVKQHQSWLCALQAWPKVAW